MSEAVRAVALSEAIKFNAGNSTDPGAVVKTAGVFLTFLSGTAAPAKTSTAAGAEPGAVKEGKPSANTAGAATKPAATKPAATKAATKPPKKTEEQLAAEALEKANAEAAEEGEADVGQTEPLEATKEGVALAVKLLIEGDKRDDAIALLKKYKAASVTSMQAKDEATIEKFIGEVNGLLGLGGEPSLED